MIIVDAKQGSPEWFKARCGLPTASRFNELITVEGKPSKQRMRYLYGLAGEKVAGTAPETYQNAAMLRGTELEAEARQLFELVHGVEVRQVGLCLEDLKAWGCSPDGLIGEDSGLEIKCPMIHTHVEYLLDGGLPADYFQQVQGAMLVTGFSHWWFMSYYPGLSPLIVDVKRDGVYINKLREELEKFCFELNVITKKIGG